jgi:hypothetical protein
MMPSLSVGEGVDAPNMCMQVMEGGTERASEGGIVCGCGCVWVGKGGGCVRHFVCAREQGIA